MRVTIVAVGRLKAGPETDLVARYVERASAAGRALGLSPLRIVELPESRSRRAEERQRDEAAAILGACEVGAVVAFDERGDGIPSDAFAARVSSWRDGGSAGLTLVIGGADGLDESVRGRADLVLSFGRLTLPHQIVRVLVAEQIYRAMTILAGHPYHRA